MPERCTCGAQLPEDALFCHKCGKPQREDVAALIDAASKPEILEPEVAPPALPIALPSIGFHNATAVRIALGMAVAAFFCVLMTAPAVPDLAIVWFIVAGFFAVYFYRRRTGQKLSVLSGARLGWISGIFGFLMLALLLAILATVLSDPTVVEKMREQMKVLKQSQAGIDQALAVLRSPSQIVSGLVQSFLLFTILPALGGAVGAKLLDRD